MKYFGNVLSSNEASEKQLERQRTNQNREMEMRRQNQEQVQLPNGNDDGGEVGRPVL